MIDVYSFISFIYILTRKMKLEKNPSIGSGQSAKVNVAPSGGIFGVPLRQSITYANVAISLLDGNGKSYIYGYVPIVVAKCGVYLKEKGE